VRKRNSGLLATAAAAALVCGMAGSASACDVVNWQWNKTVEETIFIDIRILNDLAPTGLVEIEKLQMYFGDVKAEAKVKDIQNNPPGGVEGDGSFSERFNVVLNYTDGDGGDATESENNPILPEGNPNLTAITPVGSSGITLALVDQGGTNPLGEVDEISELVRFQLDVSGTVIPGQGVHDAADLPKIENAATAVANNQSITSDVPIMLHDGQYYAGGFHIFGRDDPNGDQALIGLILAIAGFNEYADDNLHTALALGFTGLAMGGILERGEVEAKAKVSDILNAYVENSATAVVNNASFKIESDTPSNHILIADLTQWAYADVTASAKVKDVTINGYTGFGDACFGGACEEITPIVSNVATAVGNNLNIKVGALGVE
jgi:hypothetical protein